MRIDRRIWLNHFEYHAQRRQARVPESGPVRALSTEEHKRIARSIATFQLGEQSDGRFLLRAAQRYAQLTQAPEIVRLMELFVAEEQSHAALLATFMGRHDIPLKRADWTDDAFRVLRRLGDFEWHLSVLLTAELIGKAYYRALEMATSSRELQALCRLLVVDELAHIGFEADLLNGIRERRPRIVRAVIAGAHRLLLHVAATIVWITHCPVLRAAGYRRRSFVHACDAQYAFYLDSPLEAAASGGTLQIGEASRKEQTLAGR